MDSHMNAGYVRDGIVDASGALSLFWILVQRIRVRVAENCIKFYLFKPGLLEDLKTFFKILKLPFFPQKAF